MKTVISRCLLIAVILLVPGHGGYAQGACGAHYLAVTNLSGGDETLFRLPLEDGETVTIRYIHSVDHTPIFEIFEMDPEGRLALQATYFQMFGAGMGHIQGRGRLDFDGRWTWIRDIHETLGEFVLRVGAPSVDHTLVYRDQEIKLSRKWAGERLHFTVVYDPGSRQGG